MIGSRIKSLREKKNFTQEDLAKRLGVTRQAICMWESDKREPRITMLNKIARVFDVTVDELMQPHMDRGIKKWKGKEGNMARCAQKKVNFEIIAPKAKRVALTGSFNSWDKTGITMKRDKNGLWAAGLSLKPGRYEYKFVVDGQWITDPANNNKTANTFGTQNSIVNITA